MTFGISGIFGAAYTSSVAAIDSISRLLRWAGWLTWLAVGLPVAFTFAKDPQTLAAKDSLAWIAAFFCFGPALAICGTRKGRAASAGRILLLGIITISPLVMIYLRPECFAGALLVLVAWQTLWLLPVKQAVAWLVAQCLVLSAVIMIISPGSTGIAESIIFSVFQIYAFLTAYVAQGENRARYELLHANAELRTTQLLLAQSIRMGERVRISRELHDVLGHDLTALALHLEIALTAPDVARQEVDSARQISKGLLGKVRDVVSLMRAEDRGHLTPLLQELAADGPQLKVHLNVAEDLDETDAGRAHALVRCLQEIITNARQHSGADNLWLDISRQGNCLVAQARDDGRGEPSLRFGHGLTGIRERLDEFGGQLTVQSRAEHGFALEFTLPLASGDL